MTTPTSHDDLDARLTTALRHRAGEVHLAPRGLGDVRRRVQRRRRRAATVGAAAVTVPALTGIAWLATREPPSTGVSPAAAPGPSTTTASAIDAGGPGWRCSSPLGGDDQYWYFGSCEQVDALPGEIVTPLTTIAGQTAAIDTIEPPGAMDASGDGVTTTMPPASLDTWPPLTTIEGSPLLTVLLVDATGEGRSGTFLGPVDQLGQTLGLGSYVVLLRATDRTSAATMVMPVATDAFSEANAHIVADLFGIGGFDTWAPTDWTTETVPNDLAFVVVLGQDWREHVPVTGALPITTTTSMP